METPLSQKVETLIANILPKNYTYFLPDPLINQLDALELENTNIARLYLLESIANAQQISKTENIWNKGWAENLEIYKKTNNYNTLAPLYTGKLPYIRILRRLYKTTIRCDNESTCNTLEHLLFSELYDSCITAWIHNDISCKVTDKSEEINIVELGCGSCQHIPRINEKLMSLQIKSSFTASDWSESTREICAELSKNENIKINFKKINLLENLNKFKIPENAYIYTINSLEQLGECSWKVIDWLLNFNPKMVMHFEPILEVLEINNQLDKLSKEYAKKRGYLCGLYASLKTRESLRQLDIISCRRSFIANANHENNTFLNWIPLH